jgi:hypothetical protein
VGVNETNDAGVVPVCPDSVSDDVPIKDPVGSDRGVEGPEDVVTRVEDGVGVSDADKMLKLTVRRAITSFTGSLDLRCSYWRKIRVIDAEVRGSARHG